VSNQETHSADWHVLGLDIGGTEIKAAVVGARGGIVTSKRIPTPGSLSALSEALRVLIASVCRPELTIRAAGMGCKGIIDPETTKVLALPGELHYLEGERLDGIVAPLLPAPCLVVADNDARVALEGEVRWGAARGRRNALMLTLGTGVGGAILADGRILCGAGGAAGHLGHVTVDPSGKDCICGNRGCLETIFSAREIESEALAAIHRGIETALRQPDSRPPTCAEVFECARRGDRAAKHIIERAIFVLGAALAGLAHAFDPEIVVLGGQIAESEDALLEPLQRELNWRTQILLRRSVPIVKSQLADPSGVLGAAALAIEAVARQPGPEAPAG
jgi:glucokinase